MHQMWDQQVFVSTVFVYQKSTWILGWGAGPKERFSPGTHYADFTFRAMGCRSPLFPCCFGWVTLPFQKVALSPFSLKFYSFWSIYTYIYQPFSSLALFTPIFAICLLWATWPRFLLLLSFGLLVEAYWWDCLKEVVTSGSSYSQKLGH